MTPNSQRIIAAWTGIMADKFSTPRREHLRAELEALGFRFD